MASTFKDGHWPQWTSRVREIESQAFETYLAEVAERAHTNYTSLMGVYSQSCESPIEALFLAAFIPTVLIDTAYTIHPQFELDGYRADFLVTFEPVDGLSRSVVVEYDGHDYHDRTKEQAGRDKRRDRAVAALGYPVLRFTGRELHRDAHACAREVVDFTQGPLLAEMNLELGERT